MLQIKKVYLPANGQQEKYVVSDNNKEKNNGVIEQEGYFFTKEELNLYTEKIIEKCNKLANLSHKKSKK